VPYEYGQVNSDVRALIHRIAGRKLLTCQNSRSTIGNDDYRYTDDERGARWPSEIS
jgi:hypothetical protein